MKAGGVRPRLGQASPSIRAQSRAVPTPGGPARVAAGDLLGVSEAAGSPGTGAGGQDSWQGEHAPSQPPWDRGQSPSSPIQPSDRGWPPSPSPVPGGGDPPGAGRADERVPAVAGAGAAQRHHPGVRDQVLREGTSREGREGQRKPAGGAWAHHPSRAQDKEMQSYSTLKAVTTRATVSGLKPGTRYMFQVRARTSAGCGRFSQAMEVETGKPRECGERGGRESWARPRAGALVARGRERQTLRLREWKRLAQGDGAGDSPPNTGCPRVTRVSSRCHGAHRGQDPLYLPQRPSR